MIIIHVDLSVKAANQTEFEHLSRKFRAKAKQCVGCKTFEFYKNIDRNCYAFFELWDSIENFTLYEKSEVFNQYRQSIGSMLAGKPSSDRFLGEAIEHL